MLCCPVWQLTLLSAVPDVVNALAVHHKVADVAHAGLRFLYILASSDLRSAVELGAVRCPGSGPACPADAVLTLLLRVPEQRTHELPPPPLGPRRMPTILYCTRQRCASCVQLHFVSLPGST